MSAEKTSGRVALIAGASGLVGGLLLRELLASDTYREIVSIGRRTLPIEDAKLRQLIVDFAAIPLLPHVDDAFSCLGSTIKKAGSKEAFYAVDHDAVVAVARAAKAAGAARFLHVSSLGADARSRVFYNRVKGETEADVASVGVPCTIALRPSIIDGDRGESRPGERIGLAVTRFLAPVLGKYKPTHAATIARAMVRDALASGTGARVLESTDIERAGAGPAT